MEWFLKMIDFVKYRKISLAIFVVIIFSGIFGYIKNNGFAYGVDFTGGTELRIKFSCPVDIAKLRHAISHGDDAFFGASIQSLEGDKEFIVKVGQVGPDVQERFESIVSSNITPDFTIVSAEQVGPEAGKEIQWNAIVSVLLTLLVLLFYISIRHRYDYAVGAVAALGHDIITLLCFYLLFNEPITLNILAAILAVLGYSLNDTIVVYNRIKDNLKLMRGKSSMEEIVNISISQTLRRTLLTSFSTLISMVALYLFGGEVLRGFSITMMIAVVVGTYSSIYIASPVMLLLTPDKN